MLTIRLNREKKGMSEPVRVLHVFSGLDSGGVSNFVMNLYRELDTDKIQFDFAMTSGKKVIMSLSEENLPGSKDAGFSFATRTSSYSSIG